MLDPSDTASAIRASSVVQRRPGAPGRLNPNAEQPVEHILRAADRRPAVDEQGVRPLGHGGGDRAGDRAQLALSSSAAVAVISEPEGCAASTTTVIAPRAAMILLRLGNAPRSGRWPGGASEITAPRRRMSRYRRRSLAGYTTSAPLPRTASVIPSPASAPR